MQRYIDNSETISASAPVRGISWYLVVLNVANVSFWAKIKCEDILYASITNEMMLIATQ